MVSGYVLLAAALYQITTRDDRYTKKGSMEFVVTENARYKYDLGSIADAVFRNMDQNRWSLYPCEPNWIYTLCNLVGISGLVASDKVLGNNYGDRLKERFGSALASEFSNADGTILPIRSELTGVSRDRVQLVRLQQTDRVPSSPSPASLEPSQTSPQVSTAVPTSPTLPTATGHL